jgi:hypothetical protein
MSAQIGNPARHGVYVRRTRPRKVNGESGGWRFDPRLRCQEVVMSAGLNMGHALINYVQPHGAPVPIEDIIADYHPDDQVRVELYPYDDARGRDSEAEGSGLILFEGPMTRIPLSLVAQADDTREKADFICTPLPTLTNKASVVTGRWYEGGAAAWSVIEAQDLPAAFNYKGRANMDADDAHAAAANGAPGGGLTARPFTHDDDPAGEYWTVNAALASLLVQWLYGNGETTRDRTFGVEKETLDALSAAEAPGGERWSGLDDVLPETDVTGMHLLDALDAVCRAGGFRWAIEPDISTQDSGDRRYLLNIWRRFAGPPKDFNLPKRGRFGSVNATVRDTAGLNRYTILRDNAAIINDVTARGRTEIEATVPLKPLWSPGDVEATSPAPATHALPNPYSDTYHSKHVQGGSSFNSFAHVGRMWGVDCTGASTAGFYPEADAAYTHDPAGFDWLGLFAIPGDDPVDPITAERSANGISTPINWIKRIRHPRELTRPAYRLAGRRYVLQVSENSGSSWTDITDRMSFTTLTDFFGVMLTGVPNLAAVNAATLGTGQAPAIADSWWQKLLDKTLRFRLACNVPADHAPVAKIISYNDSSGSEYIASELIDVDVTETWSAPSPGNVLGASTWQKIVGAQGNASLGGDLIGPVVDAAVRLLDARDGTRIEIGADGFLLQPWKFPLGASVRGIQGRNIGLASNGGGPTRYPEIVSKRLVLSGPTGGGEAQGMYLSLTDTAITEGV